MTKLKLIFLPFLIIALCVVAGYTFLNWLLIIRLHAFSVSEEVINIGIPMALPWIPLILFLRPRVKLLNLKYKKGNISVLYILVAGFALIAPTLVAQIYIEKATGTLTALDHINQINDHEVTKYYSLKNYYLDKQHFRGQSRFDVSGKYGQSLFMNLFMVVPIYATVDDTSNSNCLAWYGIRYFEDITNDKNQKEKDEQFQKFAKRSESDLAKKDLNQFIYLERIEKSRDYSGYMDAIKNTDKISDNSTIILLPINEPFGSRGDKAFNWIFGSFAIGGFLWLLMVFRAKIDGDALIRFRSGIVLPETNQKDLLHDLIPHEGFFITPVILGLNVLIFIIMVISGLGFATFSPVDLLHWGGNYRPSTIHSEWWRLLTNIFLHGGLMHLVANMYGLIFVGIFLEPRLGKTKYIIIYLGTGIIASIVSLLFHKASVSVGASGAIFGLYGVFLALLMFKAYRKHFTTRILISILVFVGFNLIAGLKGGIDNAAHVGGLSCGFIIGLILYPQLKREADKLADTQIKKPSYVK